jgi:Mannosyltransferase (PIG-V)
MSETTAIASATKGAPEASPTRGGEDSGWRASLAAVWVPIVVSRLLVWAAGIVAMLARRRSASLDPPGTIAHLDHFWNVVLSPAARWDAVWYLAIAEHGYRAASPDFFPLYPYTVKALAVVTRSAIAAGIVVSLVSLVVALCVLYRLVEIDYGPRVARITVWVISLFPMALFFSAIYTESLFLALTVGAIYAARRERWAIAGLLGGLAAATRNTGLLLLVPLLVLYVRSAEGLPTRRPRPRELRDLAWFLLIPAGLAAYVLGMGISRGTPFAMFNSKAADRGFELFPVTIVKQFEWTIHKIHQLHAAGRTDLIPLGSGIVEIAFLLLAIVATVGVVRRLDRSYAAYVVAALIVLLCEPVIHGDPLTSFPRYIVVLFPLWIWVALAIADRPRLQLALLSTSAVLLAGFTTQFATWRFVA